MYSGGAVFTVEHFHFLSTFLVHPAVQPLAMHRFAVNLKAIAVDVSSISKCGFHCGGFIDSSSVQAEILHIDRLAGLAVFERVHYEMLIEGNRLQHICLSGGIRSVNHGTTYQ